jgi:hypothetical protein
LVIGVSLYKPTSFTVCLSLSVCLASTSSPPMFDYSTTSSRPRSGILSMTSISIHFTFRRIQALEAFRVEIKYSYILHLFFPLSPFTFSCFFLPTSLPCLSLPQAFPPSSFFFIRDSLTASRLDGIFTWLHLSSDFLPGASSLLLPSTYSIHSESVKDGPRRDSRSTKRRLAFYLQLLTLSRQFLPNTSSP